MSLLNPFEVFEIEVWPLPQFENTSGKDAAARAHLDALERQITQVSIEKSEFKAILNEKDPPSGKKKVKLPRSHRGRIVSDRVYELRSHPDFRLARRALIISHLAQVISERKVQGGLRRVLLTQAKRLQWLSERRYEALGGAASVEEEGDDEPGELRSRTMRAVKGKDTQPEWIVRRLLHGQGTATGSTSKTCPASRTSSSHPGAKSSSSTAASSRC